MWRAVDAGLRTVVSCNQRGRVCECEWGMNRRVRGIPAGNDDGNAAGVSAVAGMAAVCLLVGLLSGAKAAVANDGVHTHDHGIQTRKFVVQCPHCRKVIWPVRAVLMRASGKEDGPALQADSSEARPWREREPGWPSRRWQADVRATCLMLVGCVRLLN